MTFTAVLWEHDGDGAWHFVTLPEAVADEVEAVTAGDQRRGFGSVRVEVTVGATTWRTSLFPDSRRRSYVLPVKQAVRRAEGLAAGGRARFHLVVEPER